MGSNDALYRNMGRIIHTVAWCILFGLPFFFTGNKSESVTLESYVRFVAMPLSFMFVFYVNYFWLIRNYLLKGRVIEFLFANLALIILTMIVVHLFMQILPEENMLPDDPPGPRHPPHHPPEFPPMISFFLGNAMLYMLIVGLSVAIRMTGNWYKMESIRQELERSRAEAELMNLKSQLNPHFLFNTLNNIYSLISFSPEEAQCAMHDLSRLLRYVLYDSSQSRVPLDKELDFIRNYVELMRIRLPRHAVLETDIKRPGTSIEIAPLLFISLIENAFKHGVSNNLPSFIRIFIAAENKTVVCRIENSYFPKDKKDHSGSGIGLVNLRKRLDLLYRGKYNMVTEQRGDTYFAELTITETDNIDMNK